MEHSSKIPSELSFKILTVGTDFHNHRGGVGAVIEVYSHYYGVFNFIASHKTGSSFYKSYVFLRSIFKLVFTLISNKNIQILHIHGSSFGSFYRKYIVFVISKYIFRKKVIYHMHGGCFKEFYEKNNKFSKLLIKNMLSHSDIVICLSQSWVDYFTQNFKFKKILGLPNMIDYPSIIGHPEKKATITFLFLGLVCKEKGIFDLIKVIEKNRDQYRGKIKLLIGGNGEVQHMLDLIRKYQIEDIVEYLGWISSKVKADVLNNSDVYILPSYFEGLPISILESMSYGKAIISTNVGGIPEIVRNHENGLLINPGDLDQIKQALDYFIEKPELIEVYGATSKNKVEKYLPHSVVRELISIYKSLLSNE